MKALFLTLNKTNTNYITILCKVLQHFRKILYLSLNKLISKLLNMKNLKKLAKSRLKEINGGATPNIVCRPGTIACPYKEPGFPMYWICESAATACGYQDNL